MCRKIGPRVFLSRRFVHGGILRMDDDGNISLAAEIERPFDRLRLCTQVPRGMIEVELHADDLFRINLLQLLEVFYVRYVEEKSKIKIFQALCATFLFFERGS